MEIIERFIKGKREDDSLCEDGLYVGEHFIAVIDGVTAKGEPLKNGASSGCEAKNVLLHALTLIPADIDAEACLRRLDGALADAYERLHTNDRTENFLRAAIVIYSKARRCIWSYGDCLFAIDGHVFENSKPVDRLAASIRSILLRRYLQEGATEDELLQDDRARAQIMPLLKLQQHLENAETEFGYPVLNGHGIAPHLIVSHPIPEGAHEIILASDGYPLLKPTLRESEEALAEALADDPLCYKKYPGTKGLTPGLASFDDRCYCRFRCPPAER